MTASTQFPLDQAYQSCRQVIAEYSKTFYLSTKLFPPPKRQAMWAVYCWCRRTDELVDGLTSNRTTLETLNQWERRLENTFAGRAETPEDTALAHAVYAYKLPIAPFRDMVQGMRMDLTQTRYRTFDELSTYCYRVAGTVGLMTSAVMGFVPGQDGTEEAISLGVAMQLTNILRDVGEDAKRGRIYLPLADLEQFNYSEEDLFNGVTDARWMNLMDFQIQRARGYYQKAAQGVAKLQEDSRFPVWAALLLYQGILEQLERNDYQNFERRAFVSDWRKVTTLGKAWLRARS